MICFMNRNDVCITVSEPSPETPQLPKQCSLDLPDVGVHITVTEPSPESTAPPPSQPAHIRRAAFRRSSEATIVHAALVHRESEEYNINDS